MASAVNPIPPSPIIDLTGPDSPSPPIHPYDILDSLSDDSFLIAVGILDPTDIPADPLPQSRDHALHDHALQRAIDLSFAEANPDPPPVKKRAKAPKAKAPKAKAPKAKAPKAKAPRAKRQKTQHTECSICLTGITRATLVVTQCAHTYHAKCLDTWHRVRRNAGKQPNCPYCNTLL